MSRHHLITAIVAIFACACGEPGTLKVEEGPGIEVSDDSSGTGTSAGNGGAGSTGGSGDDGSVDPGEMADAGNTGDTGGEEMPECPGQEAMCDGACVDLTQSNDHCGACAMACPGGTECASSQCACVDGGELCGAACTDTNTDPANCGDCGTVCSGGQACVDGGCIALTEVQGVLTATNAARAAGQDCGQYGNFGPAPALAADANLALAAQAHAVDMAQNNFFSHTGSDGSSFSQRVGRTDYSGFPIGENIAGGGSEAAGVVQRWIDSDGHCRNLMNPQATKLGVGYVQGGEYGTLWVQVFGR